MKQKSALCCAAYYLALILVSCAFLVGCATHVRAPVREWGRTAPGSEEATKPVAMKERDAESPEEGASGIEIANTPEFHVVQHGETLYSIAQQYGVNHHDLGLWNGLDNVNAIREGDRLKLRPPVGNAPMVKIISLKGEGSVPEGTPVDVLKPMTPGDSSPAAETTVINTELQHVWPPLKSEPKATKVPYSEQVWGKYRADDVPAYETKPRLPDTTTGEAQPPGSQHNESLQWAWPADGKLTSVFNEATKGLVIAGTLGQPVYASADGKVSYIGNSLRGYGKMVVIKHNKTYLSVYAHNSAVLVREGQTVTRGQKIAEMGNSDSDDGSVKLHFEIRRLGKPVDPLKYLPNERPS